MHKGLTVKKISKTMSKPSLEMEPAMKCQNAGYECSINAEENQKYCIRHILQDTTAPYKQCTYMMTSKQCMQAKLVEDRKDSNLSTYCFEHSLLNQLNKTKASVGSFKQIDSTETLVHSLTHHVKTDKIKPQSTTKLSPLDDEEEVDIMTPTVNPFLDLNPSEINNRGKNILDFASDSSSDEDTPTTLTNTWRSYELDHSDDESVDSSGEDVLKHAGIYTVDEIVSISKEKMQRLQTLYMDQFQRLQYVLREKRRQYLIDLKKEKETCSSIHDQPKDTPRERKHYKNLKALNHYHKRYGPESLLHRQFLEKRQRQAESALMAAPVLQSKNQTKCLFSEGGVKCNERVIPCCRFCRKHIMEDKKQILFKACGVEKSGIVCQESVFNIFDDSSCVLHTTLPSPKTYVKRKYESETEEEEGDQTTIVKMEEALDVEMDTTTYEVTSDSNLTEAEIKPEITIEPTSTDEIQVA